jgi:hypothetical protein
MTNDIFSINKKAAYIIGVLQGEIDQNLEFPGLRNPGFGEYARTLVLEIFIKLD